MEACLEAATAPLIGLMDADDRGDPERFGRLLEAFQQHLFLFSLFKLFHVILHNWDTISTDIYMVPLHSGFHLVHQKVQALREHPDWQGACSAVRIFGAVSEAISTAG